MQKVDAVIAVVGAVALIATVVGVVFYEDLAGEQEIVFTTGNMAATAMTGSNGEALSFAVPNNATGAALAVTVDFSGQSGQGGTAQIQIDITGPNGTSMRHTGTMAIGPNANSVSVPIAVDMFSWATVPEARVADPNSVDETMEWTTPLTVAVTVTAPADPLLTIPGNLVNYNFSATVTPTFTVYTATVVTPEVETL